MDLATLWPLFDEEDEDFDEEGGPSPSSGVRPAVTFPATFLVSRVQIALGADLSADPLTWAWEDITRFVRTDLGISLTVGRRDEATTVTTGSGQIRLDNRDGRFSRRNPNSPYYGLLSMNTPIWVTVDAGSGEKTRMEMYVNEWPTRWDRSGNDSTVTIACAGILRRLAQGGISRSALTRSVTASDPVACWLLEDPTTATEGASAVSGGHPMVATSFSPDLTVAFGETGAPGGVASAFVPDGSTLTGQVDNCSSTAWCFQVASLGPTGGAIGPTILACPASTTAHQVQFYPVDASLGSPRSEVDIINSIGGLTLSLTSHTITDPAYFDLWHDYAVVMSQTGTTLTASLYVDGVLEDTDTATATVAPITQVTLDARHVSDMGNFSHIAISNTTTPTIGGAAQAYVGEMAHARIARLCNEEGVPYASVADRSQAMGPQATDAVLTLIRDAETVGGGVLYEKRWGLSYQSLRERYNAPVGLALDFDAGQIAMEPEPADDDQRVLNVFAASRTDGSTVTVSRTTGPMGTGAQGPGRYEAPGTLNVETDGQLTSQARWRVHLGTIDEDRWPSIALNFAHDPDLIDTWASLGYGARLTVANPPSQVAPDPLDQVIEGHAEAWDQFIWTASLNCSPASAYRVHVVASTDGNLGRVDAASSYLAADATSSATTLSVASPGALWRTGAVNFDIGVGGERMTVTNISGSSSPQTFTVTRSVNGIVKAQAAVVGGFNTKVSLWKPGVYAL